MNGCRDCGEEITPGFVWCRPCYADRLADVRRNARLMQDVADLDAIRLAQKSDLKLREN